MPFLINSGAKSDPGPSSIMVLNTNTFDCNRIFSLAIADSKLWLIYSVQLVDHLIGWRHVNSWEPHNLFLTTWRADCSQLNVSLLSIYTKIFPSETYGLSVCKVDQMTVKEDPFFWSNLNHFDTSVYLGILLMPCGKSINYGVLGFVKWSGTFWFTILCKILLSNSKC